MRVSLTLNFTLLEDLFKMHYPLEYSDLALAASRSHETAVSLKLLPEILY
jgi:hypothetical protein